MEQFGVNAHLLELLINPASDGVWCRGVRILHILDQIFLDSFDEKVQISQIIQLLRCCATTVFLLRL